jgi:UDP-N-acetylmuramoyl-L-alanyl-D-glutamate--2,6-diaminopimelate ligase
LQVSELIADIPGVDVHGDASVQVRGITADSRDVRAGYLFAAFPGVKQDGRAFIAQAVEAGACAVLAPVNTVVDAKGVTVIEADAPRRAFAKIAANFAGAQVPHVAAVTGTNGKSSTVSFCRQIWQALGISAASLGTVGITANLPDGSIIDRSGALTTPDPVTLHAEIAKLAHEGVTHLALEASSQGLHQARMDGLKIKAAGFTNLTRDHIDYHLTMDAYLEAKLHLFGALLETDGIAVVNADAEHAGAVRTACVKRGIRVIEYGMSAADIRLETRRPLAAGQYVAMTVFGQRYDLELPLVGDFQAMNALCALGIVTGMGADVNAAVRALEGLKSVRGRLELAGCRKNGAAVYVDYAHTPDGLETMLRALRPHTQGKLHVVVGCGGDRDKGKRPIMGEIAVRLADVAIVTDDNPRTEDAAAIRAQVMEGAKGATEIANRADAIRAAVKNLNDNDVLVIAGKGHEQGQIVGRDVLPFDDVTEARKAIQEYT